MTREYERAARIIMLVIWNRNMMIIQRGFFLVAELESNFWIYYYFLVKKKFQRKLEQPPNYTQTKLPESNTMIFDSTHISIKLILQKFFETSAHFSFKHDETVSFSLVRSEIGLANWIAQMKPLKKRDYNFNKLIHFMKFFQKDFISV